MANKYDVFKLSLPLRLSPEERNRLLILTKALDVSEYTDHVERPTRGARSGNDRQRNIEASLDDFYRVILGLQLAANPTQGTRLNKKLQQGGNELSSIADYFTDLFEIGRRYKMMNPDRMRAEYGKLIYLLQDACNSSSAKRFGFTPKCPIKTVQDTLRSLGVLDKVKEDGRLHNATVALLPGKLTEAELAAAKADKERVLMEMVEEYGAQIPEAIKGGRELLERSFRSIDDANCYVRDNVQTLDQMISLLENEFKDPCDGFTLEIRHGYGGARMTHSHEVQYYYVLQSLHLWRLVSLYMYHLWVCVEEDMLSPRGYNFRNTGQGYNRVQRAEATSRSMGDLVQKAMKATSHKWVGLSAVHLGDDQVPNALNFIDKYTAVARIINPILTAVSSLDRICEWEGISEYIKGNWHNNESLRASILRDYFRFGFDGSGGDNPADAGSCIDGRLTSSWNWCNKISSKSYHPVFLLTGFTSFDAF